MRTKSILVVLWTGLLLTMATQLFAQAEAPQTQANQLFLPLVTNGMREGPAGQDPTMTPAPTSTTTPVATPSPTPEMTPEEPVAGGFFVETGWKTSSGDIEVDAQGGMHVVHANYEAAGGEAPTGAVYRHCVARCEDRANWSTVHFDGLVSEIQLELTPGDQPRIVMRMDSSVTYPGGADYNYAECNANCDDASSWSVINVATNFGTIIFDLYGDSLPQRYFALDPAGRPRFLYFDRNYVAEPDHLGLFYAACDQDCTDVANWTQTLVTQASVMISTLIGRLQSTRRWPSPHRASHASWPSWSRWPVQSPMRAGFITLPVTASATSRQAGAKCGSANAARAMT